MNDDRIDLSALDPSRDKQHWQRLVHATAQRAQLARRRPPSVGLQLVAWARPALAIAASLVLVSWAGALSSRPDLSNTQPIEKDSALTVASWAMSDQLPSTQTILEVYGASHGPQ